MRRLFIILFAASVSINTNRLIAETGSKFYGQKGTFELATGFSGAFYTGQTYNQIYEIAILPYANHFIFERFFLRYDFGIDYRGYTGYNTGNTISASPGLAFGYSLKISESWFLNFSSGLQLWSSYDFGYSYNLSYPFSSTLVISFYPELKYVISERWTVAIASRILTNIRDTINNNTYFSISYIF